MAESGQDSELTLEARIVTNAEQVAKEIGDMMDSAAKSGQKAARSIKQEFANITPGKTFLDAGRQIIKMSEQMGQSIEKTVDTIKEQNRGLEKTKEELLFAARAAKEFEENIKRIGIDDLASRNVAGAMLQNAGIGPSTIDPALYEQQLTQMQERLELMAQESETVEELTDKVDAYNAQLQNSVAVSNMVSQVIEDVDAAWTEMGVVMPKEQTQEFVAALGEVVTALEEQKITAEEAAQALAQMRAEYIQMGQAQAAQEQSKDKGGGGILESITGGKSKGLGQMLLGGATKLLTGAVAAFGIAKIAGEVQKVMKESVALGNRAEVAQVNLTIAVREHQRAVGELSPTIAEANKWTQELSDKYLMTQNEAEGLVSQTLLLTKDLHLSAEETKNVAEQAAVLGQVFGRDVGSTLRTLTEALNTGRTEGLDAYGIALDSTTLKTEAVRRGLMSAGDELDIYTKRQVIAAVLEEKVAGLREDSAAQLETTAAKLAASQEAVDETKEKLGLLLKPFQEFYELTKDKALTAALQLLILAMIGFGNAVATVAGQMQGFMDTFMEFQEMAGGGAKGFLSAVAAIPSAGFQAQKEGNQQERIDENLEAMRSAMEDLLNPGADLGDIGAFDALGQAVQSAFDETIAITEDGMKQLTDRTRELYDEYNQTIMDIMADFAKRRAELDASYRQDVADAEADYQRRKQEAQVQFNRAERREAEDHKIEMRRLEEDYLMELDDLVRERDAKGVLMAQRRYNVEKRRKEEDFDLGKKRRAEDFQYEQKQAEYQRALRLQQMKQEYEERRAALAEQERDALQRASEAFQRQIELERKAAEESLRTILEAAKARLNLSQQELRALYDMLVAAQPAFRDLWAGIYGSGATPSTGGVIGHEQVEGSRLGGYARGGSFFAVGPTAAVFGEGGPERVDVTPLSASTGQARPGFGGGGGNGRMQIELDVKADPLFLVEVSEKTMSDVADVVVRLTKAETGGLR